MLPTTVEAVWGKRLLASGEKISFFPSEFTELVFHQMRRYAVGIVQAKPSVDGSMPVLVPGGYYPFPVHLHVVVKTLG